MRKFDGNALIVQNYAQPIDSTPLLYLQLATVIQSSTKIRHFTADSVAYGDIALRNAHLNAFYPTTLKTGKHVFTTINRWQTHMHWLGQFNQDVIDGRVLVVLGGCTNLFVLHAPRIRISVKFRKVPRKNETDAQRGWINR